MSEVAVGNGRKLKDNVIVNINRSAFCRTTIFSSQTHKQSDNKKTNQECYLIFCFVETSVLA
jgi:hypothetical protein